MAIHLKKSLIQHIIATHHTAMQMCPHPNFLPSWHRTNQNTCPSRGPQWSIFHRNTREMGKKKSSTGGQNITGGREYEGMETQTKHRENEMQQDNEATENLNMNQPEALPPKTNVIVNINTLSHPDLHYNPIDVSRCEWETFNLTISPHVIPFTTRLPSRHSPTITRTRST